MSKLFASSALGLAVVVAGSLAWAGPAVEQPRPAAATSQPELTADFDGDVPRYWLSAQDLDQAVEGEPEITYDGGDGEVAPKRWWPLVLSAVLPGLGEATTGHARGYFFIAADVAMLYGYRSNDQAGQDKEDEYLAYAEEHWSEAQWEFAIGDGAAEDDFGFPAGTTPDQVPLYVSREEDEREWFENLGKWDVFWYGWDDSNDPQLRWSWDDPPPEFMTPHRDAYINMRNESNDAFKRSDTFLTVSLLLRVVSVVQVAYLEGFIGSRYSNDALGGQLWGDPSPESTQLSWFFDAENVRNTRLGLRMSY